MTDEEEFLDIDLPIAADPHVPQKSVEEPIDTVVFTHSWEPHPNEAAGYRILVNIMESVRNAEPGRYDVSLKCEPENVTCPRCSFSEPIELDVGNEKAPFFVPLSDFNARLSKLPAMSFTKALDWCRKPKLLPTMNLGCGHSFPAVWNITREKTIGKVIESDGNKATIELDLAD